MSTHNTNMVTRTTTALDQEKFLAAKLLQRAHLKLVAASLCDKVQQPKGTGIQAHFVRYKRMNLPTQTLTEGVRPANSSIGVEEVTAVLDQWGDVITLTDVTRLTTKHPLVQIATDLLSDNAQRLIDREVQIVMNQGTNVQFGDGTVTTRATVTQAMTVSDTIFHKARVLMVNNGAPPRTGPSNMKENASGGAATGTLLNSQHYVAVSGPELTADLQKMAAATGLWASVVTYQNAKAVYNGEVGSYLGFRIVETNFIPKFKRLGNKTAAVTSAAANGGGITGFTITAVDGGGTLNSATTYFWKITRKNLLRGFEEDIAIAHSTASTATGNNESFSFAMPSTAGYVYNVYFDTVQTGGTGTDATLRLVHQNVAAGATVTVTAVPATGANPPASNRVAGGDATDPDTIHPMYVVADQALAWVGLQQLKTYVTGEGADKLDPLGQFSTIGYKFMAKAVILDQERLLRLELPSAF
jgi:N4-gp56 family major capsid protein